MKLAHISFVNWHTYDDFMDIDVEGHLAIVGVNGGGKSTLLDLLQVVLTGCSQTYYRLNAKADDSGRVSGRTVASYCLGALGGDRFKRNHSLTYLALGFADPAGRKPPVSIGLVLDAHKGGGKVRVIARFIVRGRVLVAEDLIQRTLNGDFPKPWADFNKSMKDEFGEGFFWENNSAIRFVREWMLALVPSQSQTQEAAESLLRAIVKGITLKADMTATDFIRQFVLPENPIRIKELRESIATYKRVQDIIVKLREKLESMHDLRERVDAYGRAVTRESVEGWISRKARLLSSYANLHANFAEKAALDRELSEKDEGIRDLKEDISETEKVLRQAERQLAAFEARTGRSEKLEIIASGDREIARLAQEIQERKAAYASLGASCLKLPGVAGEHASTIAEMATVGAGLSASSCPQNLDEIEASLSQTLAAVKRRLDDWRATAGKELVRTNDLLDERKVELEAAESERSGAGLSAATTALLQRLRRAGMDPQPLCHLLEIDRQEWKAAAEGLLGADREAIFVDREHFAEADRILRTETGAFRRATLVSMPKISDTPGPIAPNSFASLFSSEQSVAIVYVQRRHGEVRLSDSVEDFNKPGRALMRDGFYDDGLSRRHRAAEPSDFKIGHAARQARLVALREEVDLLEDAVKKAEADMGTAEIYSAAIASLSHHTDPSSRLVDQIAGLVKRREDLETEIAAIDAEEDGGIRAQIAASRQLLDKQRRQLSELENLSKDGSARRRTLEKTLTLGSIHAGSLAHFHFASDLCRERFGEVGVLEAFRREYRERLTERGIDSHVGRGDFERMREIAVIHEQIALDADGRHARASERVVDLGNRTKGALRHHFENHATSSLVGVQSEILSEIRPWLATEIPQIEANELREYEEQAVAASSEAGKIFRAEFVHALTSRVRDMKNEVRTLNGLLKDYPFHREQYSFAHSTESKFAAILKFADLPEGLLGVESPMEMLFRDDIPEDHEHYATIREVRRILEDPDIDPTEFEDYRNYHSFEIDLTNLETGHVSSWSERIGTGSGAEKQIPIYVAVAAALANAFGTTHSSRKHNKGVAFAIFDEVFAKFDGGNQQMMMSFLENLGLQLIIAAPLDSQIKLQEHMDTMIEVGRWKDNSHVEVIQIGERTRESLKAINPAYIADDQARQMMAEAAE